MNSHVLRGHMDMLILAALEPAPRHGYAVVELLRRRSGGILTLPSGTIYPALRRLEMRNRVVSHWHVEAGRRRRVYELTPAGHRALAGHRRTWHEFSTALCKLLGTPTT
jgi:PadR family transcriptional regulator, regulatory protein PadR